jgi:hypothetical protein
MTGWLSAPTAPRPRCTQSTRHTVAEAAEVTLAVVTAYTRADEAGRAQREVGGRKLLYDEN